MKEETFNDEMAASKERELHSEAKIHTKRFSALRLGMGALLPVLSTFWNPDFITAYVFTVLALLGPNLYSYMTTHQQQRFHPRPRKNKDFIPAIVVSPQMALNHPCSEQHL